MDLFAGFSSMDFRPGINYNEFDMFYNITKPSGEIDHFAAFSSMDFLPGINYNEFDMFYNFYW